MDRSLSPSPQWPQNITENLISRSPTSQPQSPPQPQPQPQPQLQLHPQPPRVLGPRPFLSESSEPPSHASLTPHSPDQDSINQRPSQSTLRDPNTPFIGLLANLPKDTERPFDPNYLHAYDQEQQWNALQKGTPWWSADDEDGFYSLGCLLFLFGFLCPPLWWIGSFWPRHARELGGKMAERWQRLNRCMSIGFSILLLIALIVLAVLESRERN
ncbi:hypothetical protein CLU79DRAFT_764859 [Phycomyces nitens]|nr:hypothetical protein CLU79DRAFT_764859 [Phycomyces nitens]